MKGASTGLNLTPREYLEMLTEEYRDYQEDWHAKHYKVSMRKAINCCGLSNAMPEIILVHYGRTDPEKVHRVKNEDAYRKHLRKQSEAHHTVRDICDYSKHAKLDRKSVSVKKAELIKLTKGSPIGFLLTLTHAHDAEWLAIRHKDGRVESMDEVLKQVTTSWKTIFDQDKL
jgi:hypothetical protein